eukprot:gene3776-4355_t
MKPIEYLDHLKVTFPDLADQIEQFILFPQLLAKKELVNLYEAFIKDFESKLKPLSLVEICIAIARQLDNAGARKFIEQVSQKVKKDKSGYILALSFMASKNLASNDLHEAKVTIELARDELKGITGLEPIVYSSFYLVCTDYHKARNQPSEFYQNALMYLSYCKLETLSAEAQSSLAFDLGIAALVGENVYSFGDLIVHPILKSLEGTPNAWLILLLKAFNIGDIVQYESLIAKYRDSIAHHEAITTNHHKLAQKIAILALLDLAFRTPSEQRTIAFETIAQTTRLPVLEVEHLLMKALSLNLIKGFIDQIDQNIMITWVTPRILDLNQIATMKGKIIDWTSKATTTLGILENETGELFV